MLAAGGDSDDDLTDAEKNKLEKDRTPESVGEIPSAFSTGSA